MLATACRDKGLPFSHPKVEGSLAPESPWGNLMETLKSLEDNADLSQAQLAAWERRSPKQLWPCTTQKHALCDCKVEKSLGNTTARRMKTQQQEKSISHNAHGVRKTGVYGKTTRKSLSNSVCHLHPRITIICRVHIAQLAHSRVGKLTPDIFGHR